jgi:hypothetical protein
MRAVLLLVTALLTSSAGYGADLLAADLPHIHAEYKANQARWAREFLDKTFAATMTLDNVSNVFGNDRFRVTFQENPSDWLPGVACEETPPSDFLISRNKGDSIFVRGAIKDHSMGSLELRDCEFFDSEKAAADADAKHRADEAAAAERSKNLEVAKQRMFACLRDLPSPHDGVEKDLDAEIERDVASCGQDYVAVWQQGGATKEQSMAAAVLDGSKALAACRT